MTETGTDIDTAQLESYLSDELNIVVATTEVLHDGLNLSIAISAEENRNEYVLRRPNKMRYSDIFNELEQEYRLMQRLEDTALPTPTPILFCDDDSVLGAPFFVTTFLDGAGIPLGSDLPERFQNVKSRSRVADLLIDTLAEIHSLDIEPFEDVCTYQTVREQIDHTTDRLDAATNVTGHELPTLRAVGEWLQQHAPSDSKTTLVHGDFRPSNVLFSGTKQPGITGILDWETAFLGNPLTELGYLLLRWRDDNDPTPSLDELDVHYSDRDAIQELREANENGLSPFTANPGSPSRRELVTQYENKTGISFESERFYRAHAAFGLATVWEGLHRYHIETGMESPSKPLWVEYMALIADSIINEEL